MALAAVLVATNSSEASGAESTQMYEGQEEVHSSQPQENTMMHLQLHSNHCSQEQAALTWYTAELYTAKM